MTAPTNRFRPKPAYTSIVGLSTTMRMPRLGKIRLGIKAKNAKGVEYPKDVDYFVCPPEVQEVYGEHPKELDVLIPSADPSLYFPQALKWYKGARLVCKGNGETATRIDTATGNMTEISCPCEHLKDPQTNPKGECCPRANLMVILPKVSMGGAYQIDSGSTNNIINLNSTLSWIQSMLGRVAWVPLTLKRVPTKIQTPDGTTTKSLLQLEFKGDLREAAALRQADWISIQGGAIAAALPPHVVDDDGPADTEAEAVDEATGEVTQDAVYEEVPGKTGSDAKTPPVTATEDPGGTSAPPPAEKSAPPAAADPPPAPPQQAARSKEFEEAKGLLFGAQTLEELNALWNDAVVKSAKLTGDEKFALQDILLERKKWLQKHAKGGK
jgi:hypothetical protein